MSAICNVLGPLNGCATATMYAMPPEEMTVAEFAAEVSRKPDHVRVFLNRESGAPTPLRKVGTVNLYKAKDLRSWWAARNPA